MSSPLLPSIKSPADLQSLNDAQLLQLADEMREELVRVLSIRPAHFASNLGVVELCLALHLTFDFSKDRLIWDTGHQIYPHKLITGRHERFDTIRTKGGLRGRCLSYWQRGGDMLLRKHDCFAPLLLATDQSNNQAERDGEDRCNGS